MRTSHEIFEPQRMKNNYGKPQGPTVQLSHKSDMMMYIVQRYGLGSENSR
jgi:hypothetical protein